MAKALRGEIDAELKGSAYKLRLAVGDLEELEEITGKSMLALAMSFTRPLTARLKDARVALTFALKAGGHKISDEQVRAIIEAENTNIYVVLSRLMMTVLMDDAAGNAGGGEAKTPGTAA